MPWLRFGIRFITASLVISGIGYLLPIFSVLPLSHAALAGLTIAGFGYLFETFILKKEVLPFTHGLISFILSLLGLIFLRTILQMEFSWLGLLLAALLIGLVDLIIPSTLK